MRFLLAYGRLVSLIVQWFYCHLNEEWRSQSCKEVGLLPLLFFFFFCGGKGTDSVMSQGACLQVSKHWIHLLNIYTKFIGNWALRSAGIMKLIHCHNKAKLLFLSTAPCPCGEQSVLPQSDVSSFCGEEWQRSPWSVLHLCCHKSQTGWGEQVVMHRMECWASFFGIAYSRPPRLWKRNTCT